MIDGHHILHNRQEWHLRTESKKLREQPSLIPKIPREMHELLHHNCPPVPLLGYHALRRVLNMYEPDNDPLRAMGNLQDAIEEASWHPKSHPLESRLAELAIWAIDLQKPYIREGLRDTGTRARRMVA